MNTPDMRTLGCVALTLAFTLSGVAVAAEPHGAVAPAGAAAPAAAKPTPRQSPYARAARQSAQESNGALNTLQGDGKLATARKALPRDQARSAAAHAKTVQKHAAH